MATDDLNAPLGLGKGKRLPKLPASPPQILAGALGLSGLVVVGWATFVHDPLGGQPVAVVATKLSLPGQTEQNGSANQPAAHEAAANTPDGAKAVAPPPPGSKMVTIIDGSSGARQQVVIPDNSSSASKPLLDSKLLEATRHGAIPKIGPDGERPSVRYAQARDLPPDKKDAPLVAIVIGGLGISALGTADAFTKMPPPVTFALAPYGADLEKLAERGRAG